MQPCRNGRILHHCCAANAPYLSQLSPAPGDLVGAPCAYDYRQCNNARTFEVHCAFRAHNDTVREVARGCLAEDPQWPGRSFAGENSKTGNSEYFKFLYIDADSMQLPRSMANVGCLPGVLIPCVLDCLNILNRCPGSLANAIRLVGWPKHCSSLSASLQLVQVLHQCNHIYGRWKMSCYHLV